MVMHKNVPYIRCRDGIYYFVRRVQDDVKSYYSSDRISMSLRTKSNGVAIRATKSICQRLDDYWLGLRLQKMDIPAIDLVGSNEVLVDSSPNVSDALDSPRWSNCSEVNPFIDEPYNNHIKDVSENVYKQKKCLKND